MELQSAFRKHVAGQHFCCVAHHTPKTVIRLSALSSTFVSCIIGPVEQMGVGSTARTEEAAQMSRRYGPRVRRGVFGQWVVRSSNAACAAG